jgi:hypothetical protein
MERDIKKLAGKMRKGLKDNILERYDNQEYWDIEVVYAFVKDNNITKEEAEEIIQILK